MKYKHHRYPGVRPAKQTGAWTLDFIDHNHKRKQVTYKGTEADAVKHRRALLAKVDRIKANLEAPPEAKAKEITLGQLWEAFEADRRLKIDSGALQQSTLNRCRDTFRAFTAYDEGFSARLLTSFVGADITAYLVYRREMGCAAEGRNIDLRKLKTLFAFAVKHDYLAKSPLADVRPARVPKGDVRFLDDDELKALDKAMSSIDPASDFQRDARDLTIFYLFTGARVSEALYREDTTDTFDWSCVGDKAVTFLSTKAGKTRSIPMVGTVKTVLEGRKHIPGGPFPLDRWQVGKRVKWMLNMAGITHKASPHTLRKTAGAWYYMGTRDIFAASMFLGHSTVVVTQQHYSGLIQSLKVEYSEQFEKALQANLQLACNLETKPDLSRPVEQAANIPAA